MFLSVLSFQTDVLLTCLSWKLGYSQPIVQKRLMVSQVSGHISSSKLAWHWPSCRARCAKNNSISSHSPTILLVVRFARVRLLFLHSADALSATRSFLSKEVCLCQDSIEDVAKLLNDQNSVICRRCNPIHVLLWFYSRPCFTKLAAGVFRIMSEHIVVSCTSRIDDNLTSCSTAPPAVGVKENASCSSGPSVNGSNKSNIHCIFPRSRFPLVSRIQWMVLF